MRYYQVLKETSQAEDYPVWRFASYAIQGFIEELREQLNVVQQYQLGLAWISLVNEMDLGQQEGTSSRRRALVLALPPLGPNDFTALATLDRLNPDIAALYATKTAKTMTRDVNVLWRQGLVVLSDDGLGLRPALEQLYAFLPIRKQPMPTTEAEILATLAAVSEPLPPLTNAMP